VRRDQLATAIADRLVTNRDRLAEEFNCPGHVRTFVLDDLLDADVARRIYDAFPPLSAMRHRRSLREDKYVATQMDRYDPLLEEILYAFQEAPVVEAIGAVTGLPELLPDARLYAGGISAMTRGQYLSPHIDNSHRENLDSYRILNLLYYTTPGWQLEHGGNLQVWDRGMSGPARTIESRFNRLVVMATSTRSWHGVNRVADDGIRTCVSNYYFARRPVTNEGEPVGHDYFHVTTFRGFPGEWGRNAVLVADGIARGALRRVFKHGVRPTTQVYEQAR
jgi:Rps23 Pro-64 3,4-dihydroxylase Tpa1-like proline 4-hydroxylase